jgi:hypothetical protein
VFRKRKSLKGQRHLVNTTFSVLTEKGREEMFSKIKFGGGGRQFFIATFRSDEGVTK